MGRKDIICEIEHLLSCARQERGNTAAYYHIEAAWKYHSCGMPVIAAIHFEKAARLCTSKHEIAAIRYAGKTLGLYTKDQRHKFSINVVKFIHNRMVASGACAERDYPKILQYCENESLPGANVIFTSQTRWHFDWLWDIAGKVCSRV